MTMEERLSVLEGQVAELLATARGGAAAGLPAEGATASRWWLLDRLTAGPEPAPGAATGEIAYGGRVTTADGELVWQSQHPVGDVLGVDATELAPLLAALGHPARLELLRRILLGAHTLAELQETRGIRTTGQVHHHLRELRNAGFIVSGRNHFSVVPDRVVVIVVVLAALAGRSRIRPTQT